MLKLLYKICHFTSPYIHHNKFPTIGNTNMADARTLIVRKNVTLVQRVDVIYSNTFGKIIS